jgi:murein endopeptidase
LESQARSAPASRRIAAQDPAVTRIFVNAAIKKALCMQPDRQSTLIVTGQR